MQKNILKQKYSGHIPELRTTRTWQPHTARGLQRNHLTYPGG